MIYTSLSYYLPPFIFITIVIVGYLVYVKYSKKKKSNSKTYLSPADSPKSLDESFPGFYLFDEKCIEGLYKEYTHEDKIKIKEKERTHTGVELSSQYLPFSAKNGSEKETEYEYNTLSSQSKYNFCIKKLISENKVTVIEDDHHNSIFLDEFDGLIEKLGSYSKINIDARQVEEQRKDIINRNKGFLSEKLDKQKTIQCLFDKQEFLIIKTGDGFDLVLQSNLLSHTVKIRIYDVNLTELGKNHLRTSESCIEPFTIFGRLKYSAKNEDKFILVHPTVIF